MKEIDPSSFGASAHEMLTPDLIRRLARHCYALSYDDPEVGHSFLVPGIDDPEQLETVYIDMASTNKPYDQDSLWHRTLEFLKLADYVRPPSYKVQLYPDAEQIAKGETAARTVTIDAGNKSMTGQTIDGATLPATELERYARYILGIQPSQETENLTPSTKMNNTRIKRVLQAFAEFTQGEPHGEIVETHEVTAESATAIFGVRFKDHSYGLMWHSPLVRPQDGGPQSEQSTPYVLRWRHFNQKPGSFLDDRVGLTQPPDRTMTRDDIDRLGIVEDEAKLVLPIGIHDDIVKRFERILSETTPESLVITGEELAGLRTIAEDGLHFSLYFMKDSTLIPDSLFERPDAVMVFNSADYIQVLRLTPTSNRRDYIADFVLVPPDSQHIQQAVRAVVRRKAFGSEMLEQTTMAAAEARTLVREALNPSSKTGA